MAVLIKCYMQGEDCFFALYQSSCIVLDAAFYTLSYKIWWVCAVAAKSCKEVSGLVGSQQTGRQLNFGWSYRTSAIRKAPPTS